MTNEEKAKEIAHNNRINYYEGDIGWGDRIKSSEEECYDSAMEMAEWKDKQFVQEKEKLIDNVCEWLKNNIDDYIMTGEGQFLDSFDEMYEDLKKAMKQISVKNINLYNFLLNLL